MPAILCIPEKRFYTHDRQGVKEVKRRSLAFSRYAACRCPSGAHKYGQPILGLIFLRYADIRYVQTIVGLFFYRRKCLPDSVIGE